MSTSNCLCLQRPCFYIQKTVHTTDVFQRKSWIQLRCRIQNEYWKSVIFVYTDNKLSEKDTLNQESEWLLHRNYLSSTKDDTSKWQGYWTAWFSSKTAIIKISWQRWRDRPKEHNKEARNKSVSIRKMTFNKGDKNIQRQRVLSSVKVTGKPGFPLQKNKTRTLSNAIQRNSVPGSVMF